jgi:hypothetical protein
LALDEWLMIGLGLSFRSGYTRHSSHYRAPFCTIFISVGFPLEGQIQSRILRSSLRQLHSRFRMSTRRMSFHHNVADLACAYIEASSDPWFVATCLGIRVRKYDRDGECNEVNLTCCCVSRD